MFKLAIDDAPHLHKAAIKPYVILARELDTAPGLGQADGGIEAGTYFEMGIAPADAARKVSLAVPVKLGLSLRNYYGLEGTDHTFGYFSVGGIVTVPVKPAAPRVAAAPMDLGGLFWPMLLRRIRRLFGLESKA